MTRFSPLSRRPTPGQVDSRTTAVLKPAAAALLIAGLLGLAPAGAQESIEDARALQRQLEEDELLLQTEIDAANATYAQVTAAYDAAQQLVQTQEDRISASQFELDSARLRLAEIELSIDWTKYDLEQVGQRLAAYAVEAYLGKQEEDPTTLLVSADLNEGVTRIALLEATTNTSQDVVDQARAVEANLDDLQREANETVLRIEKIQSNLEAELAELADDVERAERLRQAVDTVRANWVAQRDEIEAEDDRLERFIANKQEAARAAAAQEIADVGNVSSDGYVWPTAGRVGSVFGNRLHPILGYYRMHSGLDIGGKQGQPIYASKAGTVILAGVNGGYGNTIVIDHGDGLSTLYAHQTSFAVSNGDTVTTGQHIGNVGSTGLSTGPHLHFEARLFGSPIDPMPLMPNR